MEFDEASLALRSCAPYFSADPHPPWSSDGALEDRYRTAQRSLVNYIKWRAYTVLTQEAYKLHKAQSTHRWCNIFNFFYPVSSDRIKSGEIDKEQMRNMWWANFPTVALLEGRLEDSGVPGGTFGKLQIKPTLEELKEFVEYPGSPFRLFSFNAGRVMGNVLQVRWDGCVSAAYMHHCQVRNISPEVREGETVLESNRSTN